MIAIQVHSGLSTSAWDTLAGGESPGDNPRSSFCTLRLLQVVVHSKAQTMMGLEKDLKDAADSLIR